jgi:hypothetical protein
MLAAAQLSSGATALDLVRKSLENYKHDYMEAAIHYTYMEHDEGEDGEEGKTSTGKVFPVNGIPYERTVMRNGKPLPPEQEHKAESNLERRQHESSEERKKRLENYKASILILDEVPEAMNFKMLGNEMVNGRENYVIDCTPKPEYHAVNSKAAMFSRIEAKLFIDKEDLQWSKAEANVLDTISIGWILARISPGTKMRMELTRLTDRDWLPSKIAVDGDARILLVKDKPLHLHTTYYDFKPLGGEEPVNISKLP